jgi:hypothetical protein
MLALLTRKEEEDPRLLFKLKLLKSINSTLHMGGEVRCVFIN